MSQHPSQCCLRANARVDGKKGIDNPWLVHLWICSFYFSFIITHVCVCVPLWRRQSLRGCITWPLATVWSVWSAACPMFYVWGKKKLLYPLQVRHQVHVWTLWGWLKWSRFCSMTSDGIPETTLWPQSKRAFCPTLQTANCVFVEILAGLQTQKSSSGNYLQPVLKDRRHLNTVPV